MFYHLAMVVNSIYIDLNQTEDTILVKAGIQGNMDFPHSKYGKGLFKP
jgi:hypothetical protein